LHLLSNSVGTATLHLDIEIPDGDYSVMLDTDYEQRLTETTPEKRGEVKRCESVQEVFDLMNKREYNKCVSITGIGMPMPFPNALTASG
jgi:hypothetical protein